MSASSEASSRSAARFSPPARAGRTRLRRDDRRRPGWLRSRASLSPRRVSSASPAGMAECVVVALEAVEVVDREQPGRSSVASRTALSRSRDQPATVAETGQRIRHRLVARLAKQGAILAERDHEPNEHDRERQCGQGDREEVEPLEMVDDEQRDRDQRAHRRDREEVRPRTSTVAAAGVLPPGECDQEQSGRPAPRRAALPSR